MMVSCSRTHTHTVKTSPVLISTVSEQGSFTSGWEVSTEEGFPSECYLQSRKKTHSPHTHVQPIYNTGHTLTLFKWQSLRRWHLLKKNACPRFKVLQFQHKWQIDLKILQSSSFSVCQAEGKGVLDTEKNESFTHLSFWLGGSLAHGGVTSAVKATSSWELDDDWSERWGGRRGGRSSSMITVSSCGMLTVGESW